MGNQSLIELSQDELKNVEIQILNEIDRVCRMNDIKYSLAYGTLLGAVRHTGFIPWDDDIDILMPRNDYECFLEYCMSHKTTFQIKTFTSDSTYAYTFAKACDVRTELLEKYTNRFGTNMGVYIDIFPIDSLPGDYKQSIKCFKKKEFQRDLIVASNWRKYKSKSGSSIVRELARFVFYLLSRFTNINGLLRKVETYYRSFPWEQCEYAGNVVDGTWGIKNVMPKTVFEHYCEMEFEGKKYLCIEDYDSFLKAIYGDYMQLPPEDKRVTHHSFTAYWKDEEK